ncbi:MAG: CPBP family intramembrane metalloprotease [Candidatus Lambdaproteobacteria bacterium]|nr:CPBP family intramembrane metalloprotease [Candidatus Lambdaproteobacteria bacterium]
MIGITRRGVRPDRRARIAAALLLASLAPALTARAANPELAAAGSLLLPGVGQLVNGDYAAAGGHFGLAMVLSRQYGILIEDPSYIQPEDREDSQRHVLLTNRASFYADFYITALGDLALYSSYGAYRDARTARGNAGYGTPAPQESLVDLALAPFRWEHLSRPSSYIPLLLPLYIALTPPERTQLVYQPDSSISRGEMAGVFFVQMNMVAVGEEAFFRGVLNNGLSSGIGEFWGLVASSALFGLAHNGQGATAQPAAASLFGLYLGWLQQRNDYRIGQGVAVHYWWNFLTSLALLQRHPSSQQVTIAQVYLRF